MRLRYIWFLSSTTMLVMSSEPPPPPTSGAPSIHEPLRVANAGLKLARVDDLIGEYNSLVGSNRLSSIRDLYLLDLHTILCEISAERGEGGQYDENAQCARIPNEGGDKMIRAQREIRRLLFDAHEAARTEFEAIFGETRRHLDDPSVLITLTADQLQRAKDLLGDYGVRDTELKAKIEANLVAARWAETNPLTSVLSVNDFEPKLTQLRGLQESARKNKLIHDFEAAKADAEREQVELGRLMTEVDGKEIDQLVVICREISSKAASPITEIAVLQGQYKTAVIAKLMEKITAKVAVADNEAALNSLYRSLTDLPAGTPHKTEWFAAIEARREALAPRPATAATQLAALDSEIGPDNGAVVGDAAAVLGWYDRLTGIVTTPDTDDATTKKQLMLKIAKKGLLALFAHYKTLDEAGKANMDEKLKALVGIMMDDLKNTTISRAGNGTATNTKSSWNKLVDGTKLPDQNQPKAMYRAIKYLANNKPFAKYTGNNDAFRAWISDTNIRSQISRQ